MLVPHVYNVPHDYDSSDMTTDADAMLMRSPSRLHTTHRCRGSSPVIITTIDSNYSNRLSFKYHTP